MACNNLPFRVLDEDGNPLDDGNSSYNCYSRNILDKIAKQLRIISLAASIFIGITAVGAMALLIVVIGLINRSFV